MRCKELAVGCLVTLLVAGANAATESTKAPAQPGATSQAPAQPVGKTPASPVTEAATAGATAKPASTSAKSGKTQTPLKPEKKVDLNNGTLAEFKTLPTIGDAEAKKIIANWDDRLRPLLKSLGLADRFEVIIVSCEIGASKPSPDPFQAAIKAFNLAAGEVLHVGDSAEMDMAGARAAGFYAAQIVRGNHHGLGPGQISSLCDLAGSISRGHRW